MKKMEKEKRTNYRMLKPKKRKEIKKLLMKMKATRKKERQLFERNFINPIKRNLELIDEVLKGNTPIERLMKHSKKFNEHIKGLFPARSK